MSGGQLVVLDRAGRDVKRYSLPDGLVTLGSNHACDIRVMLPTVSHHHATVVVRSNQTIVRNVSDGETLVNGQPISVAALKHGDTISLGGRSLRWEYNQPSAICAVNNPPSLLVKKTGKQKRRGRKRASEVTTRTLDPAVQFMLEMNHRASMPGATKQVAIVQPQRRDACNDQDTTPRLVVKPHRPYAQANKRQRTSKDTPKSDPTPEKVEEKSKRKSITPKITPKTPELITKASLWIESRKSGPKNVTPKAEKPVSTPRRAVVSASAKRSTPLRTVVLRKAVTPNVRFVTTTPKKTPVAKIQAPLKIDHTKQAALMLMTGHTPRSKLISPKPTTTVKKNASLVVKKPSPAKKSPRSAPVTPKKTTMTPQSARKSGRNSKMSVNSTLSNYPSERSSRSSGKPSMTILEISDSDFGQSRSRRRKTSTQRQSSLLSPLLPSPKKSAMKDPKAKKTSRKTESKIHFDLSNLENYSQEDDVFIVSSTTRDRSSRSHSSLSEDDLTLHFSDTSQVNSPSPRRSINSRSSRILGSVIGTSMETSYEKSTLTPESPNARKSLRGSLMVQKALESPDRNASINSSRTTKSTSEQDANRTKTSPRSPHRIGESYSIVDLISFDSESSSSVYNSVRSSMTTFGTPQAVSRKTRSTIDPNLLVSSTPNVAKGNSSRSSRASKRKRSAMNSTLECLDNSSASKRSKYLSTPDNKSSISSNLSLSTPENVKVPISGNNSTRLSRSLEVTQNESSFLLTSDANDSPKSFRRATRDSDTTLYISTSKSTRNSSLKLQRTSSGKSPRNSTATLSRTSDVTSPNTSIDSSRNLSSRISSTNLPRISSTKSPRTSYSKSPRTSVTTSPNTSSAKPPRVSGANSPRNSSVTSPRISGAKSPRVSKAKSPRISKAQSSRISAAKSPRSFAKSPRTTIAGSSTSSPKSPRNSSVTSPRISSAMSPRVSNAKSPRISKAQSSRISAAKSPRSFAKSPRTTIAGLSTSSPKSPRNSSVTSPRISSAKSPRVSKAKSPRISKAQSPRISNPQSTRISAAEALRSSVKSPRTKITASPNSSPQSRVSSGKSNRTSHAKSFTTLTVTSPRISSNKSPRISIVRLPRTSSPISPRVSTAKSPRISLPQSPTISNAQSPRILAVKSPRSNAKSPRATMANLPASIQSPRVSSGKSTRASHAKSSTIFSVTSPRISIARLPRTSSPISPKVVSPKSNEKSLRNSRKNLTMDIQMTPPMGGLHTPENSQSPEEASTPILSIQSLLNSSQASIATEKSPKRGRLSTNLKRKTIGVVNARSEPLKSRNSAKSKTLNSSAIRRALSRLSKDSSNRSDKTDEDAPCPSKEDTTTPKSTVKLIQETVKEKHSTAKKPQSKRSIIDNLNDSDIVKQLFSSPVKRKLSQSMTEFSRKQSLELNTRKTRKSIALTGRTPDVSFSNYTVAVAPEEFVSPLSTPANSPNVSRVQRMFRNTSQKSLSAIKEKPATRARKSVKNDLTNVSGVKKVFAKSPRNSLSNLRGVKDVFASPPVNDLRRVSGVKALFQSTRKGRTPKNDLTDVAGVRELYKAKNPSNDLRHVSGVKNTLRKSPKNDLQDVRGVKRLFIREKSRDGLNNLSGVEELFDSSFTSERDVRNVSNSEALFDQLVGKPIIKATYAKSFSANTGDKTKKKRSAKSLNVSFDVQTNNVEEWLEKEIQKRVSKNDSVASTSRGRKSNSSTSLKSINKTKNVSGNVPKELQNLITDTVDGNEPLVTSRVRTSTMLKSVPDILESRKEQNSLPIKKRSFVEASLEKIGLEKISNESKAMLPLKKRALVHSTPVKGQWNLTADVSALGRVSPIVADKTTHLNISRSTRKAPVSPRSTTSPKAKLTSPKVKPASPKGKRTTTVTNMTQPKVSPPMESGLTRATKAQNSVTQKVSPVKRARSTRGRKTSDIPEITNTKRRRTSLVITKKAPVLSPKPSPLVTRKGRRNAKIDPKVEVPQASPRKITRKAAAAKASPKKVETSSIATKVKKGKKIASPIASPKKITRGKNGESSKASPKKPTRGKKVSTPTVTPKKTRGEKVETPKAIPKRATRRKKMDEKSATPKITKTWVNKNSNLVISKPSPQLKHQAARGKNTGVQQLSLEVVEPKRGRAKKIDVTEVPETTRRGRNAKVQPAKDKKSPVKLGRNTRTNISAQETKTRGRNTQVDKPAVALKKGRKAPAKDNISEVVPKGRKRKATEIETEIPSKTTRKSVEVGDSKTTRSRRNAVEVSDVGRSKKSLAKDNKGEISKTKKIEKAVIVEKRTRKTAQKEVDAKPVTGKKAAEEAPKGRKRKSDLEPAPKKGNKIQPAKRARKTAEPKQSASPVKTTRATRGQKQESKASTSTARSRRR